MISPHNNEDGWNTITLAGRKSPGVVTLSGHAREVKWDVQEAAGTKGASMVMKTKPAGKFSADFYLADQDDFDAWDAFQALIESSVATDPPTGLDVVHPDLQRNKFTSVVMGKIGEMRLDGKGGGRIKVDFQENLPKTEVPSTPATGSKSGGASSNAAGGSSSGTKPGGSTDPNDPIANATAELNDLLDEGDSL